MLCNSNNKRQRTTKSRIVLFQIYSHPSIYSGIFQMNSNVFGEYHNAIYPYEFFQEIAESIKYRTSSIFYDIY